MHFRLQCSISIVYETVLTAYEGHYLFKHCKNHRLQTKNQNLETCRRELR